MMICVFDTETTSLDKPFCYNIGYVIVNTDTNETIVSHDFVVEQIWHNLPLFSSAYYANKRPLYINSMRSKKSVMDKFGYICSQMRREFKQYNVSCAYAFNSSFDEKVFDFNCDWFKCINPFDEIPVYDIRGLVHNFMITDEYKQFCEDNQRFTDNGHYSTTAETVFQFIHKNINFEEAHTALADSEIEAEILLYCVKLGASLNTAYTTKRSIYRQQKRTLHLKNKNDDYYFEYSSIKINKTKTEIKLS